jgi:hypothetical protein
MTVRTTRENLLALKQAIIQERQQAISLDLDGFYAAMQEKENILTVLANVKTLDEADQRLADEIRHENRRNAFLFKSTLGWIRETMEFFGKKTSQSTYSANAGAVNAEVNGRLLSGRV